MITQYKGCVITCNLECDVNIHTVQLLYGVIIVRKLLRHASSLIKSTEDLCTTYIKPAMTDNHTTWFGFYPMTCYFWEKNGLNVICSHVHYFFYSSHTTYKKLYRLLLIDKHLVPSHHIRTYLWCHNIPNHYDVTGRPVTSSCPLFAAGVVMTTLLTSLTTTKWYPMVQYPSST